MAGTVYVLGAGASRAETLQEDFPTPLVNDFFSERYISEYWYDLEFGGPFKDSALYFVLSRYFSSTKRSARIENINIEEVYSFLHSFDKVFSGRSYRREDFELARKQLHKYLITVIRYTSWKKKPSPFLKGLVSSLSSADTIITFNWDTLVDQALEEVSSLVSRALLDSLAMSAAPNRGTTVEDNDIRVQRLHSGRLLKVHGGINLTHCKNLSCYRHENPYVWKPSEEAPAFWSCEECGSPTQEMILSPHGAKTYTSGRFFRHQATLAAEKLSIASEIVIIGYSFPIFDIEARSMLRCSRLDDDHSEAWLSEVSLVDPQVTKKDHTKAISNLLGIDNVNAHGHRVALKLYKSVDDYANKVE